jgi:hypothetical protein
LHSDEIEIHDRAQKICASWKCSEHLRCPRGRLRSQGTPGSQMLYEPQTAFGLVVLGLVCVAVVYVAVRSL